MASSNPAVKGVAWTDRIFLKSMANPGAHKVNPTLAAGDITIDIDGAGFGNPATTPSVSPAAGAAVLISLSTSEMNGDLITVRCHDQTDPQEWADYGFCIQTTAAGWLTDKTGYSLSAAGVQAIWDALTSALTTVGSIGKRLADDIDAVISTRLATSGYTAPSNSAIAAIQAKTDNLPGSPAAVGSAMTLTSGERNSVADALLDRTDGIETGLTLRQGLRLFAAALLGKVSGMLSNAPVFRDTNDSKNRISATTDANGNRTAVSLDGS